MAKAMPWPGMTRVLIPITRPASESSGPPLLPPPIAAVLCTQTRSSSGLTAPESDARRIPPTIPLVAEKFRPWGCPIAVTESPSVGSAAARASGRAAGGTRSSSTIARSDFLS